MGVAPKLATVPPELAPVLVELTQAPAKLSSLVARPRAVPPAKANRPPEVSPLVLHPTAVLADFPNVPT
jgi:hypothetical protein